MPIYRYLTVLGALMLSGMMAVSQDKGRPLDVDPDVRSVEGVVTYAVHEPVKGAVVKCEDMNTLEIRSYITEADGKYHFMNLSTNHDYELKAEKGQRVSEAKRLTKFNDRRTATIDLRLK